MREVEEWVGKTPNARVPPRVRMRIWEKHDGICYLSKRKINAGDKWHVEHIIALANGGQHRESNLAPALVEPHKEKTRDDMRIKKKIVRVRKRHLGIKKPRTITRWRKFNGEIVIAKRDR